MPSLLEDKDEIRDLLSNYCYFGDGREEEKWLGLFTEDGIWDGGQFGKFEGQAGLCKLKELGKAGPPVIRHFICNSVITVDGDTARAKSYLLVTRQGESGPELMMVNHYDDYLVRQKGKWLFKLRRVQPEVNK